MEDNDKPININQDVDDIFEQADECHKKKITKELTMKVKELMDRKRAAARILKNIEREERELRLEIAHELEV